MQEGEGWCAGAGRDARLALLVVDVEFEFEEVVVEVEEVEGEETSPNTSVLPAKFTWEVDPEKLLPLLAETRRPPTSTPDPALGESGGRDSPRGCSAERRRTVGEGVRGAGGWTMAGEADERGWACERECE